MDTGSRHGASWGRSIRVQITNGLSPLTHAMAVRNAIGVVVSVIVAMLLDNPTLALVAGVATFNVAVADRPGLDVTKAPRMLWTVIGVTLTVLIGSLVGWQAWLVIVAAVMLAFIVGVLSSYGPGTLQSGVAMIALLLVVSSHPQHFLDALLAAGFVLLAGLLQTILALSASPAPARNPDGHALDRVFRDLAAYVRRPDSRGEVPAAMAITQVHAMQQAFAVYRSPSERAPLLTCIHQLQSELIALVSATEPMLAAQPELYDRWLQTRRSLAESLESIGHVLVGTSDVRTVEASVAQTRAHLFALRDGWLGTDVRQYGSWRRIARVVLVRLDEATRLAEQQREQHLGSIRLRSLAGAMRERARATILLVKVNVRARSPMLRHAIRLSVAIAVAGIVPLMLDLPHWYWSPVAVVIVLRPYYTETVNRMTASWVGLLVGLILGTIVGFVLPESTWVVIAVIGLYVFLQRLYGAVNIGFGMTMVVSGLVALFELAGVSTGDAIVDRTLNIAIGGAVAAVAYLVWPTWERFRVRDLLAESLDRYHDVFERVAPAMINGTSPDLLRLIPRRTIARAARASAEEALRRTRQESDVSDVQRDAMTDLVAELRGIVWSTLRLEAYTTMLHDEEIDQELLLAFQEFCRTSERAFQTASHAITHQEVPRTLAAPVADAVAWMHDVMMQATDEGKDAQHLAWYGVVTHAHEHAVRFQKMEDLIVVVSDGENQG